MRVAFITYASIEPSVRNGWHEAADGSRALVLQCVPGEGEAPTESSWHNGFTADFKSFDGAVVHVGTRHFEQILSKLAHFPPSRIIVTTCGCREEAKALWFQKYGIANVAKVACEHGGNKEMGRVLQFFIKNGTL